MNAYEIRKLSEKAKRRFDVAVAIAQREYDDTIAAIKKVASLSDGGHESDNETIFDNTPQQIRAIPAYEDVVIIDVMRKAIAGIPSDTFTARDVIDCVARVYPVDSKSKRATISSTLTRLVKKHRELEVVSQGRGRRLSIFRRKGGKHDAPKPHEDNSLDPAA